MSNNKFKVLIIEDEANICSFIQTLLETNGYQALVAQTCVMGMTMFISYNPDLVILDLGLPDRDGLDAIRSIRQKYLTPIIVLSARTTEQDKIEALDLGANDYITKPFGTGELLARVRAALRVNRYGGGSLPGGVFSAQGLTINYERRKVFVDGQEVRLTQTEYNIVAFLSQHAGRVMTYAAIVRAIKPQCGFVLLDKLEQMDPDTLREFGAWMEAEGLQGIATRVSTDGTCSILIEDGYAKEGDGPAPAPAAWKAGEF